MVHCRLSVTQHTTSTWESSNTKNTNLLNPQVASTDKYGNDFLFFSTGFVYKWNVKAKRKKRKFVAKCETTDNRRMMNEWWGSLALPWSLILIKRFLVSRFCFITFESSNAGFYVCGFINLPTGGVRLVLQHSTNRHVKHIFMQMTNLRAFINKSNLAAWVSIYGTSVCNVNDKSLYTQ